MAIDWNTRAAWDASYNIGGEPWGHPQGQSEVRLHYNRFTMQKALEKRSFRMASRIPDFAAARDTFIIGGGFGWSAEYLRRQNVNCAVTDISRWVLDNQGETEESDLLDYIVEAGHDPATHKIIGPDAKLWNPMDLWNLDVRAKGAVVDEDISTNGSRNAVRRQLAGMDCIVTEGVIDGLDDPLPFIADVERLRETRPAAVVIHMTQPKQDHQDQEGWNWRTAEEWKVLLTDAGFEHHKLLNMSTLETF